MFGFLMLIRGFFGLLFIVQIIWLFNVLLALVTIDQEVTAAVLGELLGTSVIKFIALVVSGGLFFGLRKLINWLHARMYDSPHPALIKKWAL